MKGNGSVAFRVHGKPVTQGDLKPFQNKKTGKIHTTHANSSKLKPWRVNVGWAAREAWRSEAVSGPVRVSVVFRLQRPKSHFGTGKNIAAVKPSAPVEHTQVPDVDKLARAILDALTGVIFEDDKQVCGLHLTKRWVEEGEGALIIVETEKGVD